MKGWLCNILCQQDKLKAQISQMESEYNIMHERYQLAMSSYALATNSFSDSKKKMLKNIQEQALQLTNMKKNMLLLEAALDKYKDKMVPSDLQNIIDGYNNKYTHASINHLSYMFAKNQLNFSMDIRNWITPQDIEIEKWNISKKIPTVFDAMGEGLEFHPACDYVANKFLSVFRPNYKWDKNEFVDFNISDLWQMPFQTLLSNQGDCEDFSNLVISCLNNRGIPEGLTRNVCGKTYNGYGHSTVNYLTSDLIWKHIEATSSHGSKPNVLKLRDIHDESDSANIEHIWYSFSHTHSNSKWINKEQSESWNEFKRNKYTIIKR